MMGKTGMSLGFFHDTTLEQRLVRAIISKNLTENLLEAYKQLDYNVVNACYEHSNDAEDCLETFLTLAAKYSSTAIVLNLLEHPKANPNVPNEAGNTALHIATDLGRIDLVACLIRDPRTDIAKKNADGASALDLSRKYLCPEHPCPEIEEILMKEIAENSRQFRQRH